MQAPVHVAISAIGGLVVWAVTKEPCSIPIALGSGVLVDIDYLVYNSNCPLKILHAWEWWLILNLIIALMGLPWWGLAAVVGYGLHITADQISHNRGHLWYFILFRIWLLPRRIRKS